ncbi:MAG: hypothetical protein IJC56_09330 [Clostridia bacterium]|nr:hypothetical protein [Clostridia bacterium]
MKVIYALIAVFCIVFCGYAETPAVMFDDAFSLVLPEEWLECEPAEGIDESMLVACMSDGQTTVTITKGTIPDRNTDIEAYALQLQENGHADAFISAFSDAEDAPQFIFYSDPENSVACCSTLIHEKGVYTFSFAPVAADAEYGQKILDMMATFTIPYTEVE